MDLQAALKVIEERPDAWTVTHKELRHVLTALCSEPDFDKEFDAALDKTFRDGKEPEPEKGLTELATSRGVSQTGNNCEQNSSHGVADSATTVAENDTSQSTKSGHTTHKTGGIETEIGGVPVSITFRCLDTPTTQEDEPKKSDPCELKPCPFCGGEVEIFDNEDGWFIECGKCGAGKICATESKAIAAWNRRAGGDYFGVTSDPVVALLRMQHNALPQAEFQRLVLRGIVHWWQNDKSVEDEQAFFNDLDEALRRLEAGTGENPIDSDRKE